MKRGKREEGRKEKCAKFLEGIFQNFPTADVARRATADAEGGAGADVVEVLNASERMC